MEGPLRLASTFTENFLLEYTNGMTGQQFGWGRLDRAKLNQVMTLHTTYADLLRRTNYLARARGANLLGHVLHSLEQAAEAKAVKESLGSPQTAVAVISGHDTNISNLSGLLGLSWLLPTFQRDDVPPGSALIFSLWRAGPSGRHFVRLQFISQTLDQMHDATPLSTQTPPAIASVFIPGCSTAEAGYACEWSAFQRVVSATMLPQ